MSATRGRVGPAFGYPHDGCEVGLRLYLNFSRACGHKVDSEENGGGTVQLGSRVLPTVPPAVRDGMSPRARRSVCLSVVGINFTHISAASVFH